METLQKFLSEWNDSSNDRAKLQNVYGVAGVFGVLLSGLAALVNDDVSYWLLQITFLIVVVFFVNAVVWALIDSMLLSRLKRQTPASTKRPRK